MYSIKSTLLKNRSDIFVLIAGTMSNPSFGTALIFTIAVLSLALLDR